MKTKTLLINKLLFAIACTALVSCIFAGGVYAAKTDNTQASPLDQIHATNDVSCADCHGDENQRKAVAMATCLDCHDTTELAKKTANTKPTNPHKNRHYNTEADCNLCHHQHKKSENFCLPCHDRFNFKVP